MKHVLCILSSNLPRHHVSYNLLLQMENSNAAAVGDSSSKGLMRTSEHPIFWNGVYPSFLPTEVNLIAFRYLSFFNVHFN